MPLKFRLRGLAETFIDQVKCHKCGNDGGESGDDGFETSHTKVTLDGIVVVLECRICGFIFVPDNQRVGVINPRRLRKAVERDSHNTGQPVAQSIQSVRLDVERLNAERGNHVH